MGKLEWLITPINEIITLLTVKTGSGAHLETGMVKPSSRQIIGSELRWGKFILSANDGIL